MFFRSESKREHVNTLIRVAGVGLVRLNPREVGSFTLREAILAVKLEFSSHNGVLAPTVHVKGSLGKNKCASIRNTRVVCVRIVSS